MHDDKTEAYNYNIPIVLIEIVVLFFLKEESFFSSVQKIIMYI